MLDQRLKIYNIITIVLAFLEFILFLCIPFVNIDGSTAQQVGAYIIASCFWCCITAECVFIYLTAKIRKSLSKKDFHSRTLKYAYPGVFSFFKNKEAIIVDIVLYASAIILMIIVWVRVKNEWMVMINYSVFFLAFNLHCILNGKNYRYLKQYRTYKKENE